MAVCWVDQSQGQQGRYESRNSLDGSRQTKSPDGARKTCKKNHEEKSFCCLFPLQLDHGCCLCQFGPF